MTFIMVEWHIRCG